MSANITVEEKAELKKQAQEAAKKARCPYSHFRVGAALLLNDGRIITGFNIENPAYSATICAERSCLAAAITQFAIEADQVKAFGIYATAAELVSPCGVCRQVMMDNLAADCPVFLFNGGKGAELTTTVSALLPHGFNKDVLPK